MSVAADGRARDLATVREKIARALLRSLADKASIRLPRSSVMLIVRALVTPTARPRGRPGGAFALRDSKIGMCVAGHVQDGLTRAAAIAQAAERFNLDERQIDRIARAWLRTVEREMAALMREAKAPRT